MCKTSLWFRVQVLCFGFDSHNLLLGFRVHCLGSECPQRILTVKLDKKGMDTEGYR